MTTSFHAACDDGTVGCFPTDVGHEAREHTALELKHVGRRNVIGNQHQRILIAVR
jgi:hypothetical protein